MVDRFLLELLRKVRLPNTEFVLNYADMPMSHRRYNHPRRAIFGWCGTADHNEMMLPTWESMQFASDIKWNTGYISNAGTVDPYPWRKKKEVLFWRGGDFGANGRRQFVALARQHPR